ncbi:hypothetical protein CVD19_09700 [Bacillus sp. T33-2]|nr:hypothetical protein CVD19_09700 [Bacillus sp. T33-2]
MFLLIIGVYFIYTNWENFDGNRAEGKEQQVEITDEIDLLQVEIGSVTTTIIPEDRDDVKAELDGDGQLEVDRDGDSVEVIVKDEKFNWFNLFKFNDDSKLVIHIPEDYDKDMAINLGSGNVDFGGKSDDNPMKLRELQVEIGSGDMNLKNLDVKDFIHDGSSGDVEVDSLTAGQGSFNLSSGDLIVKHYSGPIKADVSSGDMNFQLDELIHGIEIGLSSGDVGLDLPDDADFTLNGEVSSGDISCDFPLSGQAIDDKSIKGKHGSGKHQIEVDVSSGDVEIH